MSAALKQLRQHLQGEGPGGLYVLLGEDRFAREAAVRAIERALAGKKDPSAKGPSAADSQDGAARRDDVSPPDLDRTVVHADDVGVDGVAVAVGSSSLFGEKRLVILSNFAKLSAAQQDRLVEPLSALPTGVVVIIDEETLDGRRKATKALQKAARIYTFALPKGAALTRWVIDHGRSVGLNLSSEAAKMLLDMVPPEPQMIHTELEKLALYAGGESPGPDTVREVASIAVPHAAEKLIFRLTELIVAGETENALGALHDLLAVGEIPLVILTMIGRQYRLLAAATGSHPEDAKRRLMRNFRLPPRVADQTFGHARRLGEDRIAAGLRRVLAADEAIKKSQDPRLTLETLVVALADNIM